MATITTDSDARKGIPVFSGFMNYFPLAMAEVARLSREANEKHNPGEPLHWSKGKSNDHADCLVRHQLEWNQLDDDGFYHAVKVAWRAMAQLQILLEAKGLAQVADPLVEDAAVPYGAVEMTEEEAEAFHAEEPDYEAQQLAQAYEDRLSQAYEVRATMNAKYKEYMDKHGYSYGGTD